MWSLFSIVQHFTAYWVILDITLPTLSLTEYLWHTLLVCGLIVSEYFSEYYMIIILIIIIVVVVFL